jgi:hypothetical protein
MNLMGNLLQLREPTLLGGCRKKCRRHEMFIDTEVVDFLNSAERSEMRCIALRSAGDEMSFAPRL